jgi:hypothetical protein
MRPGTRTFSASSPPPQRRPLGRRPPKIMRAHAHNRFSGGGETCGRRRLTAVSRRRGKVFGRSTNGANVSERRLESHSLHFSCDKAALSPRPVETCPIDEESATRTCESGDDATIVMPTRSGEFSGAWTVAVLAFPPPPSEKATYDSSYMAFSMGTPRNSKRPSPSICGVSGFILATIYTCGAMMASTAAWER